MPKPMARELLGFGLVPDLSQLKVANSKKGTFLPVEVFQVFKKGVRNMAKTKSSVRGKQHKKIVVVKPYRKSNGKRVGGHRRSTPN